MQLGLLVFAIEGHQRSKTHYVEEVQVAQTKDQRSPQLRKAADCLDYQVGVRCVDFTIDAQDGGYAARVNKQLRPCTIDLIAAARFFT